MSCVTSVAIRAELVIGEGTVKTHVNHLFSKLPLRDRAAAIVFALDHGVTSMHDPRRTRRPDSGTEHDRV